MKVSELAGALLEHWVMRAEGYTLIRVGYTGTPDETPEQKGLPDWFNAQTDHSVGCFWMRESDKSVIDANDPADEYETPWGSPASPSTDWAIAGPIIGRESIAIGRERDLNGNEYWAARVGELFLHEHDCFTGGACATGPDPLIAAMRAYVASKFGDDVPDL